MEKKISVIIPVFNESANLRPLLSLLEHVFACMDHFQCECIVVNDGSTDDTRPVLEELRRQYSWLRPLHMCRNSGQSAALLAGMRVADGEYIITMDGDLQNDPRDIPGIVKALARYDCVCGYRAQRHDAWHRRLTSWCGNRVRRWIVDDGIRDAGCGMKGFRRNCLEHMVPFNGVHRFLAAMARNGGLSVTEIPVAHHPRKHGRSKYGLGNRLFWVLYDFVGVAWLRRRYIRIDVEAEPVALCDHAAMPTAKNEKPVVSSPDHIPLRPSLEVTDMGRHRLYALGLLVLAAVLFLVNLGGYDLWAPDEPRYGLVAWEMMRSGDYFLPHVNNQPYKEKPPLLFWLIAAASYPQGDVTSFTTRLPSAAAALVVLLFTWLLARRILDEQTALWSLVILMTMQRFWWNARFGQIDMLLTACLTVSLYAYWRWEETEQKRYLAVFYLGAAAGLMAKGPGVLVFPVLFVLTRTFRSAARRNAWMHLVLGCAAAVAVYALWAVPAHIVAARELEVTAANTLASNMFRQTIGRFLLGVSHANWPWYYGTTLPVDWLPWTAFLPWALPWVWRRRRENEVVKFLLCWIVPALIFFSIAIGKRGIYLLPLFPAFAMLFAASVTDLMKSDRVAWRRRISIAVGAGFSLIGAAPFVLLLTPYRADYWTPGLALVGVAGLAAGALLLWPLAKQDAPRVHLYTAGAFMVIAFLSALIVMPIINVRKSARDFCAPIRALAEHSEDFDLYSVSFAREEYVFYSRHFFKELYTDIIPLAHEHDMDALDMLRFQRDLARAIGKAVAKVEVADVKAITPEELSAMREAVEKTVLKGNYSPELIEDFKRGLEAESDAFFDVFDSPRPAFLYVQENDWRWIYAIHPDVHGAVVLREDHVGSRHVLLIANPSGATLLREPATQSS